MRRLSDVPWEMWSIFAFVICIAIVPIILGSLFFKIYREFKPLESPSEVSLATLGYEPQDGFFKRLLVGWLLFLPLAAGLYYLAMQEA